MKINHVGTQKLPTYFNFAVITYNPLVQIEQN